MQKSLPRHSIRQDLLDSSITKFPEWEAYDDHDLAVFFHLYGVTDRDDIRYIYSTFPIVKRQETAAYGTYLSCDLCLAYMNALAAGQSDADVSV